MLEARRSFKRPNGTRKHGCPKAWAIRLSCPERALYAPFKCTVWPGPSHFQMSTPWTAYQYADDLVIITELPEKLILLKTNIERKGLRQNQSPDICGLRLDVLQKSDKNHCVVCLRGVCTNTIVCAGCSNRVPERCSGTLTFWSLIPVSGENDVMNRPCQ